MKNQLLTYLLFTFFHTNYSQYSNSFNSSYSPSVLKNPNGNFQSFYLHTNNTQVRSVSPTSRYNLSLNAQPNFSNQNQIQNSLQNSSQFGVNYASPASRVSFTPTSQQQVTNSSLLTENDLVKRNQQNVQETLQQAIRPQQRNQQNQLLAGTVQIKGPLNLNQQNPIQQQVQDERQQELDLINQLSFDFNNTSNTQNNQNTNQPVQQPVLNNQTDLAQLLAQLQNQQQNNSEPSQPQQSPTLSNLDPEAQQLQLLINQLAQQQQPQTQRTPFPPPQRPTQSQNTESNSLTQLFAQPASQSNIQQRNQESNSDEDLLSQFLKAKSDTNQIESFFASNQKQATPQQRPSRPQPQQQEPKQQQIPSDINLFELFNNQGDSSSFGESSAQGEVVHFTDDPSSLNYTEPEVTSIDQFLQEDTQNIQQDLPIGGGGQISRLNSQLNNSPLTSRGLSALA